MIGTREFGLQLAAPYDKVYAYLKGAGNTELCAKIRTLTMVGKRKCGRIKLSYTKKQNRQANIHSSSKVTPDSDKL